MHYYFIDPFDRLIHRIEGKPNLETLQALVEGRIESVPLNRRNMDTVFVNEEFLFMEYEFGFLLNNNIHPNTPLRGYGIYIGCDDEGESDTPKGLISYGMGIIVDELPYKSMKDFKSHEEKEEYLIQNDMAITRITSFHGPDLILPFKQVVKCDDVQSLIKKVNERNHFNPNFAD